MPIYYTNAMLRSLIDTLPDLIWLKDPKGVYLACNHRFEQFFGASEKEIVGKTDYEFVDKALADSFRDNDRTAMEKNGPSVNEEEIPFASDGHRELLETTKTPMRTAAGDLIGVLGIGHDISGVRRNEQALRESEGKFRRLVENSPDILYTYSTQRGGQYYSPQVENLFGRSREEIQANPQFWDESIHPDDRSVVAKAIDGLRQGSNYKIEYRIKDAQGNWHWLFDRSVGCRVNGDELIIEGLAIDITERKRIEVALHDSEMKYRILAERSPLAIQVFSPDGTTLRVNPAWERLWQVSLSDLKNYNVLQDKQLEAKGILPLLRRVFEGETIEFPDHLYEKKEVQPEDNGKVSKLLLRAYAYPVTNESGQVLEIVAIQEDISVRKAAETDILEYQEHLQHAVETRTKELFIAKETAETANIAKSAFLANMSHEIRTPLNAITGMAHILRRSGLTPQQTDKLDKIEAAGNHLLEIINAILDLSKIEAGKFTLKAVPVNVVTLLDNIASMLSQKAKEKRIVCNTETVAIPYTLLGDPTRLQQALLNYAANALKFLNPWAKNINSFRMKYNHDFSAGRSIFPLQGGQIPPGQHRKAWRSGAMSCPDPLSLSARQGYPFLPRGLPEAHRGRSRAVSWTSRRQQSRLNMGEDRHDVTCAGAKVEEQVPRPGDELRPPVHDFLQYGLQATTHGRMSDRRQFADQPQLADQTQTVVGEHRDMQHRIVGIELARGQSFQIEVGLDLRMELLVRAVILVALDDPFGRFDKARPPAFDLDFGFRQALPLLVDGPFDDPNDQAKASVLLFPGALHVKIQEGLPFAGANLPKGVGGFSPGNPRRLLFRGGLAARVPFDEVLKAAAKRGHPIPLLCVREQQAGAVKATVGADQHRGSGRHQTGDTREDSL
jgi:PAS domain S-box-containing protein